MSTNDDRQQVPGQGTTVTKRGPFVRVPEVLDKEDRSAAVTLVVFFVVSFVLALGAAFVLGVAVHLFRLLAGV